MVMNTRSGSQANRQRRSQQEPIVQSNPTTEVQSNPHPPLLPLSGGGDQDRITAMKAQIEALT
jgi:hypothetical protein